VGVPLRSAGTGVGSTAALEGVRSRLPPRAATEPPSAHAPTRIRAPLSHGESLGTARWYAAVVNSNTSEVALPAPREVEVRRLLSHADLDGLLALRAGEKGLERPITHPRVQKSGLVLVGHVRGIVPTRLQIFGETEMSYLESLDPETRAQRVRGLFALGLSCVVVTRGVEPFPEMLEEAALSDTPLVVASHRSSRTINAVHAVLDRLLAPSIALHGVLVDIHGVGVLLLGPSGIGKSECALFLVERGHRLVADDQVVVSLLPSGRILGQSPDLLRYHLEVRGIGILNIREIFGATAVREDAVVDLVVELCPWRQDEDYDRLGLDDPVHDILGSQLPMLRIPVTPGRDMGVILEVAARNQLLKQSGIHPARRFATTLAARLGLPREDLGGHE